MKIQNIWLVAALALLPAAAGCGSPLVTVTGRVTYKGEPVPSTLVTFMPDDGGRPSHAVTDDNGNFTLKYSRQEVGARRGKHTVFLTYHVSNEEELGQTEKAPKELRAVIDSFGDPKTSPLHYDVTRNGQFIDIKLD